MRKQIIAGAILVLLTLLLAVPAHTQEGPLSDYRICLDPGHGGYDPGAVYNDGTITLQEADINLDVAYGLKALLEADGAAVVMTRTDDSYLENVDRYTFCNTEQATILVSVHTNSVTDPAWDGSLALYFHPHEDDKILAQAIYDVMYPFLKETAPDPESFLSFGLDWFASGVLLRSDMPAAMMEPLFMSNPAEASLLVTPIYEADGTTPNSECVDCRRAQIAQAIHDGIVAYFAGPGPGSVMHVDSIEMSLSQRGVWTNGVAAVRVVDTDGYPVVGATVSGEWTGSAVDSDTITTDENGIATLASDRTRDISGTFTFTVIDVSKYGWIYAPGANVETSDTIPY
jgi:N-acetylmuramoyl-L-alanine amidase